jgi:hypothetical protein
MARQLGIIYLLHFDRLYVPYPGAPLRDCAGHYTIRPGRPARPEAPPGQARHGARGAADAGRPRRGHHLAARPHLAG